MLAERAGLLRTLASGPADPRRRVTQVAADLEKARDELAEATVDRVACEEQVQARGWRPRGRRRGQPDAMNLVCLRHREEIWTERVDALASESPALDRAAQQYGDWLVATLPDRDRLSRVERLLVEARHNQVARAPEVELLSSVVVGL